MHSGNSHIIAAAPSKRGTNRYDGSGLSCWRQPIDDGVGWSVRGWRGGLPESGRWLGEVGQVLHSRDGVKPVETAVWHPAGFEHAMYGTVRFQREQQLRLPDVYGPFEKASLHSSRLLAAHAGVVEPSPVGNETGPARQVLESVVLPPNLPDREQVNPPAGLLRFSEPAYQVLPVDFHILHHVTEGFFSPEECVHHLLHIGGKGHVEVAKNQLHGLGFFPSAGWKKAAGGLRPL